MQLIITTTKKELDCVKSSDYDIISRLNSWNDLVFDYRHVIYDILSYKGWQMTLNESVGRDLYPHGLVGFKITYIVFKSLLNFMFW